MKTVMSSIIKAADGSTLDLTNTGIFYNSDNKKAYDAAIETANVLNLRDIPCRVLSSEEFSPKITFAIVLGGDGTILKAARYFAPHGAPVFGINLGRLGFLAQAASSQIKEAADLILKGQFRIETRTMLSALKNQMAALNDIVIKNSDFSRASRMYVHINGHAVCDYLADGIIIAAPTGSTAYSLSAGGPVIHPSLDAFVIVPICPHTMSARPLVIPACETAAVTAAKNAPGLKVSADGQSSYDIPSSYSIEIVKSPYSAKLLLLNNQKNSFYSVLKEKLNWGYSWQG